MARTRKTSKEALEEKIEKAEADVIAAKKRYDHATAVLKELLDKRDAIRKDEILSAIVKSGRSYEEILKFLNVEETKDTAEEQPQNDQAEEAAPLTHEEQLEKELEDAQAVIEEQKDKYLRLSAEFDNYRKRTMKEKAELILNGGEKSISSILPVIDDFERAIKTMETAKDVKAVKEGVELIYNKFMAVMAQNGVKVIETKDQPLDTDYHEAIAVIPAPSEEQKGKILDCVQTGYTLNDKVIRHAKVVVGE